MTWASARTPGSARQVVLASRGRAAAANDGALRTAAACSIGVAQAATDRRCGQRGGARGGGEAGDGGQRRGAAAAAALLAAPGDQRRDAGDAPAPAAARRRRRTAELVRRDGQAVAPSVPRSTGDPAGGLHRIDVQQRAVLAAQRGGLGDRLDHAGLVVRQHQADQRRRPDRQQPRQAPPRSATPSRSTGRIVGAGAAARTASCSVAPMMTRPAGAERVHRQGVGLGAAGGEHDIRRPRAEPGGERLARIFQDAARGAAGGMHRGRVAGDLERLPASRPAPRGAAARVALASR